MSCDREGICCFARLTFVVLFIGSSMALQTPCIFAQETVADSPADSKHVVPGALDPQAASASLPPFDERPVAGQNGSSAPEGEIEIQNVLHPSSIDQSSAFISGTVEDTNGNVVPDARVLVEGTHQGDRRTTIASDNGAFQFDSLKPGVPYRITIEAKNLEIWKSQSIILDPGQYFFLLDIKLKIPHLETSVTVYATQEQIAAEQVRVEAKQRVLGIIPNFYVTYDPKPVPLTTKLKYKLAFKSDTDVMTFVGVAFISAIYQAGDIPNYGQGGQGYAKRMAAGYADTTTDVFLGGAILPSLLHQDPRYFYQGTGTTKSRALHAIFSPFICKGDNGKTQPNYSSLGGDLGSGAISNFYYPESDRGVGLVFRGFLVTTGVRMVNGVVQEFVLRKLTPSARARQ